MSAAIIGVIGVVVGGGIAAFAQQLRPSSRSVRGAARLLSEELLQTLEYATSVQEKRSWQPWQPGDRALSQDEWMKRRDLLAAELARQDWIAVNGAYAAVEELRQARRTANEPLSDDASTLLDKTGAEIRDGKGVLEALSGSWPTIRQALRRRLHS